MSLVDVLTDDRLDLATVSTGAQVFPGSAESLAAFSTRLRSFAGVLEQAAVVVDRTSTADGWQGVAATSFDAVRSVQPAQLTYAADAFGSAAAAYPVSAPVPLDAVLVAARAGQRDKDAAEQALRRVAFWLDDAAGTLVRALADASATTPSAGGWRPASALAHHPGAFAEILGLAAGYSISPMNRNGVSTATLPGGESWTISTKLGPLSPSEFGAYEALTARGADVYCVPKDQGRGKQPDFLVDWGDGVLRKTDVKKVDAAGRYSSPLNEMSKSIALGQADDIVIVEQGAPVPAEQAAEVVRRTYGGLGRGSKPGRLLVVRGFDPDGRPVLLADAKGTVAFSQAWFDSFRKAGAPGGGEPAFGDEPNIDGRLATAEQVEAARTAAAEVAREREQQALRRGLIAEEGEG